MTAKLTADQRRARQREVWRATTLEELQTIAAQRGYSFGWVNRVWAAKQQKVARHGY